MSYTVLNMHADEQQSERGIKHSCHNASQSNARGKNQVYV